MLYFQETTSPWRKSYNEVKRAIWERDHKYCDKVKKNPECFELFYVSSFLRSKK